MTDEPGTSVDAATAAGIGPAGLRALWHARPAGVSPALWALMLGLDVLPWPWGEDILAGVFMVVGAVRASQRRSDIAWASAQPGRRRFRLAAALSAFRGRYVARWGLLGLRCPDDLRRHLVAEGEEHLTATPGGAILLGFHVGPPGTDLALRILGHRLAVLGWEPRVSRGWWREAWRPFGDSSQYLSTADNWQRLLSLRRARRILLDGGSVFVMADGQGKELFNVQLPDGPAIIRAGWLALHRHTGARVLPVLTHLEGRTVVVTIHPALPTSRSDPAGELGRWQEILGFLLEDHVRRFPEQCPSYARRQRTPIQRQDHLWG